MELRRRLLGAGRLLSSSKLSKVVAISAASAGIVFGLVSISLNNFDFGVQRAGGVVALAFAGPTRHMKRLAAPKFRGLGRPKGPKHLGVFVTRPSDGPHSRKEAVPLVEVMCKSLKYTLDAHECTIIAKQREIKVDQRVRTDIRFPLGLMDVVSIDKTEGNFRLLWDTSGHLRVHKIIPEEADYKLCKIKKFWKHKGLRWCLTHDRRVFPCVNRAIKLRDTIVYELKARKVLDVLKYEVGNLAMVIGGRSIGNIGVIVEIIERHASRFDDVVIKEADGNLRTLKADWLFVIGKGTQPWISLPKSKAQEMKEAHIYE